jgi:hypothetical protein
MFVDTCPLMPLAQADSEKRCLMNMMNQTLRKRFVNMFLTGEDGLIDEIRRVIYAMGIDLESSPFEFKKDYAELLMRLHKTIYGEKQTIKGDRAPVLIQVNELVSGVSQNPDCNTVLIKLPEQSMSLGLGKAGSRMALPFERDPESLMDSPIADEILHRKKPVASPQGKPLVTEGEPVSDANEGGKDNRGSGGDSPQVRQLGVQGNPGDGSPAKEEASSGLPVQPRPDAGHDQRGGP